MIAQNRKARRSWYEGLKLVGEDVLASSAS